MLEKLKEYKELIGIVVFFLGGVFWIQNSYPTKADLKNEIGVLNCLLEKYMLLTQLQIRGRDLERQVHDLDSQIRMFDDGSSAPPTLSPAMQHELDSRRADLASRRTELKTNAQDTQKIGDELARNVCNKAS